MTVGEFMNELDRVEWSEPIQRIIQKTKSSPFRVISAFIESADEDYWSPDDNTPLEELAMARLERWAQEASAAM